MLIHKKPFRFQDCIYLRVPYTITNYNGSDINVNTQRVIRISRFVSTT